MDSESMGGKNTEERATWKVKRDMRLIGGKNFEQERIYMEASKEVGAEQDGLM